MYNSYQLKYYSVFFLIESAFVYCVLCYALFMNMKKFGHLPFSLVIKNKLALMSHVIFMCASIIVQPVVDVVSIKILGTIYFFYIMTICIHVVVIIYEQKKLYHIVKKKKVDIKTAIKIRSFCVAFVMLWFIASVTIINVIKDKKILFISTNILIGSCLLIVLCIEALNSKVKSRKSDLDVSFSATMFAGYSMLILTSVFDYLYGPFSALIIYSFFLLWMTHLYSYIYDFGVKIETDEHKNEAHIFYDKVLQAKDTKKLIEEDSEVLHMFLKFCKNKELFPIKSEEATVVIEPKRIVETISLIDDLVSKYNDDIKPDILNNVLLFFCEQNGVYMSKNCLIGITENLNEKKYKDVLNYIIKDMVDTLIKKFGTKYMVTDFLKTKFWLHKRSIMFPKYRYNDAILDVGMEKKLIEFEEISVLEDLFKRCSGYRGIENNDVHDFVILE